MKKHCALLLLGLFITLSCNSSSSNINPKRGSEEGTQVPGNSLSTDQPGGAKKDPYRPHRLEGKVVFSASAEEAKPSPAALSLTIDKNEKVSGTIDMEELSLQVKGFRENGHLRCWIAPAKSSRGDGAKENAPHGVLFAQSDGNTYTGSLSMSGNGGTPLLKGIFSGKLK